MVNHMILQGRLCADPELRNTQSGVAVCSFRVAWSEKYKDNETKLFISCTAWRGLGEMIDKHFSKGKEIIVEGKLQTEDWTDRDGGKRSDIRMTVTAVHFCGKKDDACSTSPFDGHSDFLEVSEEDGELPF